MESITLDLIPNGIMPVLHASQYDISRSYHIDITELGTPYKLDGTETLTINERKGDNCICTLDVQNNFANKTYMEFTSTEQMCAVWGSNLCELRIIKGGVDLGTLNFILEVEASPIEGGIQSESEINNLYTQIDARVDEDVDDKLGEYATKAWVGEECYDKTYMNGIFEQIDNAFTGVNNTKMDKANPTGTGSFSLNRKSGTTVGNNSVAVGINGTASGQYSVAMGERTESSTRASVAMGIETKASGEFSVAMGSYSKASGQSSVAMGTYSEAIGRNSVAMGERTIAKSHRQLVFGKWNVEDDENKYAEIVGNGDVWEPPFDRSNARTLDWSGNEWLAGDLTYNGNKSLTSEVQRLDGRIDNLPEAMVFKGTLGVGGTIQTLPVASAENEGWTFKCITAGTYEGLTLKVGDTVTCFNPPYTSVYEWDISGHGDTDTDTWRAIKVNGVEKLGNGISSGSLDVVDTDNIEAEFDNDGNKLKIKTKNIYTQEQVDNIVSDAIYNILPSELTPTGAIANFSTSLELPIVYEVENTATIVHQRGANFFDKNTMVIDNSYINDTDGTQRTNVGDKCTDYIEIAPNTAYYIVSEQTSGKWGAWYDENKAFISGINQYGSKTSPGNAKYVRLTIVRQGNGNPNTVSVNYPSSETTSHAYNEKEYPILDHSDLPIIKAFNGINNLYADNGDVSATYKVSIEDYVSRHSGGGNRSVNLAKSVEEEVKEEEPKDEPLTRQER